LVTEPPRSMAPRNSKTPAMATADHMDRVLEPAGSGGSDTQQPHRGQSGKQLMAVLWTVQAF
jgi:hypothetical protein